MRNTNNIKETYDNRLEVLLPIITNGVTNSGCIPNDDAFQVLNFSLKTNCTETSGINGLVGMIAE